MQTSVPEVMDISKESAKTLEDYGAKPGDSSFANNCLLSRRLLEQGVRFVHLFDWGWDFHGTNPKEDIRDGLTEKMQRTDKPVAALIKDLRQRACWMTRSSSGAESLDAPPSGKAAPLAVKSWGGTISPMPTPYS